MVLLYQRPDFASEVLKLLAICILLDTAVIILHVMASYTWKANRAHSSVSVTCRWLGLSRTFWVCKVKNNHFEILKSNFRILFSRGLILSTFRSVEFTFTGHLDGNTAGVIKGKLNLLFLEGRTRSNWSYEHSKGELMTLDRNLYTYSKSLAYACLHIAWCAGGAVSQFIKSYLVRFLTPCSARLLEGSSHVQLIDPLGCSEKKVPLWIFALPFLQETMPKPTPLTEFSRTQET